MYRTMSISSAPASTTAASAHITGDSRNLWPGRQTKDVIIAAPDAPVEQIAGVMVAEHLKVIPIVDNKHVVGIVTRGNILDELYQEYGES